METLEYDHELFAPQQAEADKSLAVKFFSMPLRDEQKSLEAGRPIYVDTDMIQIMVRGDRNNIVVHPVRPDERQRFARAWEAYQRGHAVTVEGTPLAEWPAVSASFVEEMRHLQFYTVEQVANADDNACSKIQGLTGLRNKARVFMEYAKGAAPIDKLQSQLDEMKAQREMDEATKAELSSRFSELEAKYNRLMEEKLAENSAKKNSSK